MHPFAAALLRWYAEHRRDLPWRHTRDPYLIWLSEIILQQTRVQQGLPYYEAFVRQYPTVKELAAADEREVLRLWQGLGYYSRARNLHATARYIAGELGGRFPDSYAGLLRLKGIGPYTAAAIASFAYGEAVAVVDGNVYRVLARYLGITQDIAAPAARKVFAEAAQALLPPAHSADFNQAIMEFGAIWCKPDQPNCLFCPVAQHCHAGRTGQQQLLPVKSPKKAVRRRYLHYLAAHDDQRLLLRERGSGDVWQGLYDLLLDEQETAAEEQAFGPVVWSKGTPVHAEALQHVLTHQVLHIQFWTLHLSPESLDILAQETDMQAFGVDQVEALPKPIVIERFWKSFRAKLV